MRVAIAEAFLNENYAKLCDIFTLIGNEHEHTLFFEEALDIGFHKIFDGYILFDFLDKTTLVYPYPLDFNGIITRVRRLYVNDKFEYYRHLCNYFIKRRGENPKYGHKNYRKKWFTWNPRLEPACVLSYPFQKSLFTLICVLHRFGIHKDLYILISKFAARAWYNSFPDVILVKRHKVLW